MFGGLPDLPLLFGGSPRAGLGLYSAIAPGFTALFESGLLLAGVVVFLRARGTLKKKPESLK